MKLPLLASLTAVLSIAHHARALSELSDWSEGLATFYGGAPDGALDVHNAYRNATELSIISLASAFVRDSFCNFY